MQLWGKDLFCVDGTRLCVSKRICFCGETVSLTSITKFVRPSKETHCIETSVVSATRS